jgi:protein SCO1/2
MAIETLRIIRYGALALIALLALAWIAVGLGLIDLSGRGSAPVTDRFELGTKVVQAFKLTDHTGKAVAASDIVGRPAVVFFGFTYCPEVCPTTMISLSATLGKMGADADKLGVYFVTVDPERDTVDELKNYMAQFDPRIRGLTGAADQVAAVAKPLRVYYAKVKVEGGAGYTMDHDATVYLIDAKGGFAGSIAYGEDPATALAKLERLAKGAP